MGNVDSILSGTHSRSSSRSSSTSSSIRSSIRSFSPVSTEHCEVLNILGDNQQIEGSLELTGGINLIHEGILNIIGNGNKIKRLTFYLRQDVFGKTAIVHNDVLMVTGKGYRVTGAYNFHMYLEKTYIQHKGSLRIQGNGNTILDIHIFGRFEDDLTHNMHSDTIEIIGNGNIVRTVKLYLNQVMGPVDVEMNDVLSVKGFGNRTEDLETSSEYDDYCIFGHGCRSSNGVFEFRFIDENLFNERITQAVQNFRNKKYGPTMSGGCTSEKIGNNDPLSHNATVSNDQIQKAQLHSSFSISSGQSQGDPSNTTSCPQQCENPTSSSVTEDLNSLCQQLAQELETLKAQRLCKVCKGKDSCMTFIPCGHFVSCEDCCKVDRCPACQSPVDTTVKAFIP